MVKIDTPASIESFRRFIITSTCSSFAPSRYLEDYEVFPERDDSLGSIYVEAADKVTLKKIREITFVNARDVVITMEWVENYVRKKAEEDKNVKEITS